MELYAAIDLHSNNSVLVVTDAEDHVVFGGMACGRADNAADLELALGRNVRACRGAA
jgi:hypothetical protein